MFTSVSTVKMVATVFNVFVVVGAVVVGACATSLSATQAERDIGPPTPNPTPDNLHEIDCAFAELAFNYGVSKVGICTVVSFSTFIFVFWKVPTNKASLYAALGLSNCSTRITVADLSDDEHKNQVGF